MSEQNKGEITQRDLLGNPITRKIPRKAPQVLKEQITLDQWIEKINNPSTEIELVRKEEKTVNKGSSKNRPWEQLIISKGAPDEHSLTGRYYTPLAGVEAWSAPAERRDSFPKLKIEQGNIIFQIKNSDVWENGIRWTTAIVLERTQKGETPRIKGYGCMKWEDIQKE